MKVSNSANRLFGFCFWLFNSSALFIIYVGILPFLAPTIVADAVAGEVPFNLMAPFLGLIIVPSVCSIIGIIPQRKRLISLAQLFYAIEAPLVLACLIRFFWLRDLTPATTLLFLVAVLSTSIAGHWLFRELQPRLLAVDSLHLVGLSFMLAISLYLLLVLSFYFVPVAWFTLSYLFPVIFYSVMVFPLTSLIIGIGTMPIGMTILYYRVWRKSLQEFADSYGKLWAGIVPVSALVATIGALFFLLQQPQIQAFQLLQSPPQTDKDRQELVSKSEVIRQGLLNAYLAPYRYPWLEDQHIFSLYHYDLKTSETTAQTLQALYSTLTAPFHYYGEYSDRERAANLYAQFFDTPIQRGEREAVQRAIESTFIRTEVKAGLLDINQRRVWLAEQNLTVKPQGDFAEVELHEVYRNHTLDQQEILYYFSLPESAVITGLWLGETGDLAQRFTHVVSPRGAAQQVYNQEVQRRVDPALLEQVGPRNYRLRAFPIPPQGQGEMHLWLTYTVLKQADGWQMPKLAERRNLFWSDRTQRTVNGKSVTTQDQWLPASIPAKNVQAVDHQVVLPSGNLIEAKPFSGRYQLPEGKRFAVMVDTSYSMNAHRQEVVQTFNWLQANILKQNSADIYLTSAQPAQPKRLDQGQNFKPEKVTFYGTLQPHEMLEQFQQLQNNTTYDAVLLLTDSGSYELTADRSSPVAMAAPLWFIHLGGFQPVYDDATLQAIQDSGGGVATQIQDVMQRFGTQSTLGTGAINLIDGYAWFVNKTTAPPSPIDTFSSIAARQWITHLSRTNHPNHPAELDAVHTIAKQYDLVTPYSSMVVLVNDAQRKQLKQAEKQSDRFTREVEDQQLPQPSSLTSPVSAVPEPAEWILILTVAIGLGGLLIQQKHSNLSNQRN
jgi:putative PEP-CTERM system integral membrane protein